jgi:hypothetical protein
MARTEKKFGHATKVLGGTTITELVPVSANRRNVLINMTTTAADSVTAFVSSGELGVSQSGAATSVMSATETNFMSGSLASNIEYDTSTPVYNVATINVSGNRVIGTPQGPSGNMFYANVSPSGVISSSARMNISGSHNIEFYNSGYHGTFAPAYSNGVVSWGSGAQNASFTGSGEAAIYAMGLPHNGVIGGSSSYAQRFVKFNNSSIYDGTNTYPYNSGANQSLNSYVYALLNPRHSTINNCWLVGGAGSSYGTAPYLDLGEISQNGTNVEWMYSTTGNFNVNQEANDAVHSMFPMEFNPSSAQFAVSTPTTNTTSVRGTSIQTQAGTVATGFPNWPLGANASAGFRIVNQAASGTTIIARLLNGTITYPAAPTGVDVPNIERPLVGLKFSPDGNKLAVWYNRDYTGTGNTNSVLVIYTKGAGDVWTHTYSSGATLPFRLKRSCAFDWSADSTIICYVDTQNVARMISFGGSASLTNNVITVVGASPTLNTGTIASPVSHVNGLFTNTVTSSAPMEVCRIPSTDNTNRFAITKRQNNVFFTLPNGNGGAVSSVTGVTTGSGTVNNYVGTVAQQIPLSLGNVTQVSGVVLEAGEKLSVQATTGSRADVAAYGVEIS